MVGLPLLIHGSRKPAERHLPALPNNPSDSETEVFPLGLEALGRDDRSVVFGSPLRTNRSVPKTRCRCPSVRTRREVRLHAGLSERGGVTAHVGITDRQIERL